VLSSFSFNEETMALTYGFLKCKIASNPVMQSKRLKNETQYHLHARLTVTTHGGGNQSWDSAVNVGTDDSDDLLNYKLIFDFHHSLAQTLRAPNLGFTELTGQTEFPALDFLRSDVLAETGDWRASDVMDGSEHGEPVATLARLLTKAHSNQLDAYYFGRKYIDGLGIHDIHMNQGSTGEGFRNNGVDDHNDHNDIWQDGAIFVDLGDGRMAAYLTAFTQQNVPTDRLGNPTDDSHGMTVNDDGSLVSRHS
jgi:uncharacterized protein YukJ